MGISPYSPVKSVLRRSAAAGIVGREKETKEIQTFVEGSDGILYICGPPGTGKSATMTQFTQTLAKTEPKCNVVTINCVSLKKPDLIYEQILTELGQEGKSITDFRDYLERSDVQGRQLILVLDEIDYLSSSDSKIMYSLFEFGVSSQIRIIGIANALKLTDSMLPHLRRTGIEPIVLRFKPYTPAEITQILSARVSEIVLPTNTTGLVERSALDFLGRKVANATGDIRKALDILRKSIEIVESEYRSALSPISTNSASPRLASVTIRHISRVATQALGGVTGASLVGNLSIHEKAVLCTIVVRKTQTLSTTFDAYYGLCKRDKMLSPLPRTEFATIVASMLDNSVLTHPTRSKQGVARTPSKRSKDTEDKFVLGVTEMDVLKGIGEAGILKRFFDA
ncbi:protein of unknown function [Taphrina deformans PYCC 5710]|uniref:AAA+ ATPase domain-containing protein n=1 Tax=Taphrina deformans (strain PYCC 5710 / ATCC 11124 / CBS 356.35 / IMI 108563 / JCM 9778 / NBRC 8474) TaxID=1097556 RepID=R4XF66_TAPDE|nr:protein of unknown function [Taphrina deformans PYCC 5710]|eukprot:CCG84293.1 protein of unknown function [Taphrina deformans PYCC 5710]